MNIQVRFPESENIFFPYVWGVARLAPRFWIEEANGAEAVAVAGFPDCAHDVDLALHVIGESTRVPGAWVTVNGRRLSSIRQVRDRLQCYRASLNEPDRDEYCAQKQREQAAWAGCSENASSRPCQFICESCSTTVPVIQRPLSSARLEQQATLAEIDWCPNLQAAASCR